MKFMRNGMNMVDLAAIIPFILTVILETMDDIVIIGETACTDKKEKKISSYTVKNSDFPVPSRDVTKQTLPGGE
jgi:hypothetical protein